MCTTLFYYTCVYIYSLLNSCGYWTLNKYYYYYYYIYIVYYKSGTKQRQLIAKRHEAKAAYSQNEAKAAYSQIDDRTVFYKSCISSNLYLLILESTTTGTACFCKPIILHYEITMITKCK